MKNITLIILFSFLIIQSIVGQNYTKSKFQEVQPGYYQYSILRDIRDVEIQSNIPKTEKRFCADLSGINLPKKVDFYKNQIWHNPEISQGNTGTCWCFSTISFYESEIFRLSNQKIKLSEIFTVYCEYIEKTRRFIQERGNSNFAEGSEANAVTRMFRLYGAMPAQAYSGLINGRRHHNHESMVNEMTTFLQNIKQANNWDEASAISTIKSIMNHYLGEPPQEFMYAGKKYNSISFFKEVVKLNPDDYIEILSLKEIPYWTIGEYPVPDNWWHSSEYYNVPLEDFLTIINKSIQSGYSISIGGDVSEPGFDRQTQCAVVPDFDIPAENITDDARQFRFSNQSTTDDHGMHLIGQLNRDGKNWFLIKDSSSGSRNNNESAKEFGYYFFSEDYIKLKMMNFTIHKDMVKDLLVKFRK